MEILHLLPLLNEFDLDITLTSMLIKQAKPKAERISEE